MKIFITGVFRSGTTLISQMIKQSKELSMTYDTVNFMRFGWQRYGQDKITLQSALKLGKDFNDRLKNRFKQGFDLNQYQKEIENLKHISYANIYDIIMRLYLKNDNWGEKTLLEWRSAPNLLEMFDDMHIIPNCFHQYRI